ncbi:hypothetical protein EG028_12380 [Chitinophaga barathri]|uniref:Uncharacterized protein n=1 Tax=Chitinophaga barathri TaxID=1647451 RepID=A0A3N4MB48_9BACT|nr:hypothetical protein EG028_12380 [Chitinophaga barathri]
MQNYIDFRQLTTKRVYTVICIILFLIYQFQGSEMPNIWPKIKNIAFLDEKCNFLIKKWKTTCILTQRGVLLY